MKNIKLILIILPAFLLGSCELGLDRLPESNLSDASFWTTDDNFKQACNRLYTFVGINDIRYDDNKSDFAFGTVPNAVSSGSGVAPATSVDWNNPYIMIFTANNIIEKAAKVDFVGINRWISEAKFWRAYAYFLLVSKYGDVPLILKTLDINSPELTEPRTERAKVIEQIYSDLDFAAANLPTFGALGTADYGRISKSAALAFEARVALYEGTRQKFHSYGTSSVHLSKAVAAAEAVMALGHTLYTAKPYYNLFQLDADGPANKENILSIIYGQDVANSIKFHNIGRELENGTCNVTRPMVLLYLCTDGLPYDKSPLAEVPEIDGMSIFKNKDARMSASMFKKGDVYGNPSIYPTIAPSSIKTYFAGRKYSIPADWSASKSYVDFQMIRYAEVLLIYAEAKFELNGSISDVELDKSINLLRTRVSMPKLTNAFVILNALDMRTEIRRERGVELAQEGFRYNDIIRWKIAEVVLPKEVVGAKYFPGYPSALMKSADGNILAQTAATRTFNPSRDYLYPIPTREIALSGGKITQNPQW
jgi:hypothetical protein